MIYIYIYILASTAHFAYTSHISPRCSPVGDANGVRSPWAACYLYVRKNAKYERKYAAYVKSYAELSEYNRNMFNMTNNITRNMSIMTENMDNMTRKMHFFF